MVEEEVLGKRTRLADGTMSAGANSRRLCAEISVWSRYLIIDRISKTGDGISDGQNGSRGGEVHGKAGNGGDVAMRTACQHGQGNAATGTKSRATRASSCDRFKHACVLGIHPATHPSFRVWGYDMGAQCDI